MRSVVETGASSGDGLDTADVGVVVTDDAQVVGEAAGSAGREGAAAEGVDASGSGMVASCVSSDAVWAVGGSPDEPASAARAVGYRALDRIVSIRSST